MSRWLLRFVLMLYPREWRDRYATELQELIDELDRRADRSLRAMLPGLLAAGLRERARTLRTPAGLATASFGLVAASAIVAVLVTGGISGRNNSAAKQLQAAVSPRIERQLRSDIKNMCALVRAGRRVTAIVINPRHGKILGKLAEACETTA